MNGMGERRFWSLWMIGLALGVLGLVAAANAHLVAVSFGSQPDCVPHLKSPAEDAVGFHAANPSC
jgi:hypothetical protein